MDSSQDRLNDSLRALVLFGRICALVSSQSSTILVGFVEGFIVEFGSHLFKSNQKAISYMKVPSSLLKFGLHQVEQCTVEELDGVSPLVNFLEFGFVHFLAAGGDP